MREWKTVTKPEELVPWQQVRYFDGPTFDDCQTRCGTDEDPRYYADGNAYNELREHSCGEIFDGFFEHVEALFEDGKPVVEGNMSPRPLPMAATLRDMAALAVLPMLAAQHQPQGCARMAWEYADAFIEGMTK